jgi:serine/threonine protein kinase
MSISPGDKLGPYEILSPIGAGGMGEVYRARDTRLGRDVALKILPAELANDASRRQRFELEARAVAALSQPNIVVVLRRDARAEREVNTDSTGVVAINDTGARCLTSACVIAKWFASCRGEQPRRTGLQLGRSHLRVLLRSPAAQPSEKPSNRGCPVRLSGTFPRGPASQSAGYPHESE